MNLFLCFALFFSFYGFSTGYTADSVSPEPDPAPQVTQGREYFMFAPIPVVVSSGFFKTKATEAPGYTTVITSEDIAQSPDRTMAELIESKVPGMSESRHEFAGPIIGVRGVSGDTNAKTLYMLDGQILNHRQHFGYSGELSSPLLGDLAQVEVVDGPGAIVHGSGAILGFVNMLPKNGSDYPGFVAGAEYGFVDELYKIEMGYGVKFGSGRDLYLYGGLVEANGAKTDRPWRQDTTGAESSADSDALASLSLYHIRAKAFPDPTYKVAAYLNYDDFSLNVFLREETTGINGPYYRSEAGGEKTSWLTGSLGVRPKYVFRLTDTESIEMMCSLLLMQQGHIPDSPLPTHPLRRTDENRRLVDSENHMEIKMVGKTIRFAGHSVAAGFILGRRSFAVDSTYFHGGSQAAHEEGQSSHWTEIAGFIEDVMKLADPWTVSLGWRYDEVRYAPITSLANDYRPANQHNTSWRGATAYEIDPTSNIKLSYQEGFLYPDMAYLHWHSVINDWMRTHGFSDRLPELVPETMSSIELNYHKEFPDWQIKSDVNLYYNTYDKMLHWHRWDRGQSNLTLSPAAVAAYIADQGWMAAHINAPGKFSSQGFELIETWDPAKWLCASISYGFSEPVNVPPDVLNSFNIWADDTWLIYPTHQVKISLVSRWMKDKLAFSLSPLYQSPIRRLKLPATIRDGTERGVGDIYSHPRFVVDLAVSYKLTDRLTAKLTIDNLFRENVPPRTFTLMPYEGAMDSDNRYWYLSLEYKF